MLAIFFVSCVLSESALLEVDSSAELVSSLPFVRFALAEHEKKGRIEPHIRGGAFLQTPTTRSGEAALGGQTEVKNATMQSPAAESAEVKQIAVAPADALGLRREFSFWGIRSVAAFMLKTSFSRSTSLYQ